MARIKHWCAFVLSWLPAFSIAGHDTHSDSDRPLIARPDQDHSPDVPDPERTTLTQETARTEQAPPAAAMPPGRQLFGEPQFERRWAGWAAAFNSVMPRNAALLDSSADQVPPTPRVQPVR